ncbi:hypothetical protein WJX74_003267 [Apatococcus lobatus]|uniref:Protein arginine methyltransferase NDUFAF7 n=1 Tax=Apatococcus lobatus TaxID=904363 RepID=A0AAW1REL8_9CHLO
MLRSLRQLTRASTGSTKSILLREFIQEALYSPVFGYFNREDVPVGALPEPLVFSELAGEAEYKRALHASYENLQESWLTPVEVFQPYYGRALAKYIQQQASSHDSAIHINELGGGTGTLARNMLDYFHEEDRGLYERLTYTSIEISPKLAALQRQRVGEQHAASFRTTTTDACKPEAWGHPSQEPCFILMMEVLDNLPHDRQSGAVWVG